MTAPTRSIASRGCTTGSTIRTSPTWTCRSRFARRFGGPVLELACGSGRLLAPLAQAGLDVTGVDSSPAMLSVRGQRLDRLGAARRRCSSSRMQALDLDRPLSHDRSRPGQLRPAAQAHGPGARAARAARNVLTHDGRLHPRRGQWQPARSAEPGEELLHDITAARSRDRVDPSPSSCCGARCRPNRLDELLVLLRRAGRARLSAAHDRRAATALVHALRAGAAARSRRAGRSTSCTATTTWSRTDRPASRLLDRGAADARRARRSRCRIAALA